MNTINYLKEVYGYSTPIFLKDIRIGGKSKTSIRKDLSRAVEKGEIVRDGHGVYYFDIKNGLPSSLSIGKVIDLRFVENDYGIHGLGLDIYGYYSGYTFLNYLGISQQVPAMYEIVTNKTSSKRIFRYKGFKVLLRRGKIEINRFNYKTLQFFDIFYHLNDSEIEEHYNILYNYIEKNLNKVDFEKYISLYPIRFLKTIVGTGLINAFR